MQANTLFFGGWFLWTVTRFKGISVLALTRCLPAKREMSRFPHRSERASWNLYTSIVKWVGLAGMVVWLGGISFWLWAFGPVVQTGQRSASERTALILQAEQRIRKILWIGASAFLVSQCLALIDQAMVFADFLSLKDLSPLTIWTVVEMTNYGQWWSVRITASVALDWSFCFWFTVRRLTGGQKFRFPSAKLAVRDYFWQFWEVWF